ncbi:hypothetical protein EJ06DRAFT_492676 [Trichodelitschia bisporula]|uniref:Cell cycle control protein cwf19 n=1 Tax=Trichodelitschia bisporula TaxID=703511 RepID=A0A6G1I023_9PEZI|nr:hypothetical protein EJ06DRAFT_492676 [Trichodelitschia bisporula]
MGLSDFERELAQTKDKEPRRKRERSRNRERRHRRSKDEESKRDHHRHSHSPHHTRHDEDDSRHRRKRSRREDDESEDARRSHRIKKESDRSRTDRTSKSKREEQPKLSPSPEDEEEWVEKEAYTAPPGEDTLDDELEAIAEKSMHRDAWMEAPSSLDVDYVNRRKEEKPTSSRATHKDYELKIHKLELNQHLKDSLEGGEEPEASAVDPAAPREVNYEFGDSGAQWRMTKLKAVFRAAEETGRPVEDIALERFGDLWEFDAAREEEVELERRKLYGKNYAGKIKPSGELFEERRLQEEQRRQSSPDRPASPQATFARDDDTPRAAPLDLTALNKLKAQMMKAKLKKSPDAAALEAQYNEALAASTQRGRTDVVLDPMENRMLAGGRKGEVVQLENKRGRERGLVVENEDMSIEDMVRQERRTKGQGEGLLLAERIAKDGKFVNDLDYMDENAAKLAKHVQRSEINLRSMAISDFHKMNRILDTCPLCHHEDKGLPPTAPIVSLATRVYMTLPTEPEISPGGACIVPISHHINLLECDDDEWEEIRNFMKCLTRMYHDQGRAVIFYENAAAPQLKHHAALQAVPLPLSLGETAPAFFRESMLSADEEWSQHKKVIDTLAKSRAGLGKLAFRRSLVKEMPYFHVWFELDGGLAHIVEDANRWPRGDLFAREIIGGMLDVEPDVIKRQGRWNRSDKRVEGFKKRWTKFDWTRVLTEGQ